MEWPLWATVIGSQEVQRKFRKRDEGMFCQQDVEEVYDHYLTQAALNDISYESA